MLSSPGHEPCIRLSFPCFFSVHGLCLAYLCYLGAWDMTERVDTLHLRVNYYEISHLELELKKKDNWNMA